jgi:hypothetical protein
MAEYSGPTGPSVPMDDHSETTAASTPMDDHSGPTNATTLPVNLEITELTSSDDIAQSVGMNLKDYSDEEEELSEFNSIDSV